jgi:hypothetical protein
MTPLADPEPVCPQCDTPLQRLTAREILGFRLQGPTRDAPVIDMVALAHAAALVKPER